MDPKQFQLWMHLQSQQTYLLGRIANALEHIARSSPHAPKPPRFIRAFETFSQFDWASIGAFICKLDRHGAVIVRYDGKEYRRILQEHDIWFSRQIGQSEDADGQIRPIYDVLIYFCSSQNP